MMKNSRLHFAVETDIFNLMKKEADETGLSISALCRHKIKSYPQLGRIELMLETIEKRLNTQINILQEVKNGRKRRD